MATYNVQLPDGTNLKLEGPDGASDEQVIAQAQQLIAQQRPKETFAKPVLDRSGSGLDATLRGAANGVTGGWADKIAAAIDALVPVSELSGRDVRSVWDGSSFGDAYQSNLDQEQAITRADQQESPLLSLAGNVAGGIASPLSRLIGSGGLARSLANSAIYGGSYGAGQAESGQEAGEAALGAAQGMAGDLVGRGVLGAAGRGLAPVGNAAVQRLRKAGVPLTLGQMVGGPVKSVEDKLTTVPGLGDLIQRGRKRSIEGFNRAAINEALDPIGAKLPGNIDVGRDAAAYGQDAASTAYDRALGDLSLTPDNQFTSELSAAQQLASQLPDSAKQFFGTVLKRDVDPFVGQQMSGQELQSIKRGLDKRIASLSGPSASPADQLAIEPLEGVRDAVMNNALRQNPARVEAYRNADAAYARMKRINTATARMREDKAFSPLSFAGAVGKRGYGTTTARLARGDALMQQLADDASGILPSSIGTSGTTERAIMAGLVGTGGAIMAPKALAGAAVGSLPYIPGIDRLIEKAIAGERPAAVQAVGRGLRKMAPLAGRLGAPTLLYELDR